MTVNEPEELDDDTIDVDEDAPDEPEAYAPPSEQEWRRTQDALKKANEQAKQYRLAARGRTQTPEADDSKEDLAKAKADALTEAESTWKPRLVKAHALAAFAAAGAKSPERMARLLDLDSITFDDDGNPEGLDDQVEDLKADMPELFTRARGQAPPRGVDGAAKPGGSGRKLTATERQLQRAGLL